MQNTIPRWNLDSLFTDIHSEEYKNAVASYTKQMDCVDELLATADRFTREANDNFDFPAWLSSYLKAYSEVNATGGTLTAYAYIIYSTDTTNTEYMNNLTSIEEMNVRTQQQELKFSRILLSHTKYLEEFYKRFPEYEEYKFLLEEIIEDTRHQMSPQEEKLASELQRTGGDAWGRLQEQLISNMQDASGKTFNEIRNDAYSSDATVRKNAWQTEKQLLQNNRIAFAACMNNLKGETVLLNKKRNWAQALDRALSSSRLKKETLDALISSLEDALPMWRKYFTAKAKLLRKTGSTASATAGTAGHEGLAFYDLFAPVSSAKEKEWTFEEAKKYILKEYNSFSKDMGNFAKHAFEQGWIDAEVRPGKVGGAYDEDFPKGHQSRILSNFTGTFSDVITLAHELGHAYHFSCMKGKSPLFFHYPMTLAETASTFAETIVKQDMIAQTEGDEKIKILELDLQDASQVLVDILCRFYFERSVFEERANGELNADDFCRLMKQAQEKSYGSGLNEERHEYMWAVKSHYYSTGLDFYNFPYAFGQLFAAGLYAQSKKAGAEFAQTYAKLLSDTGSMSCEDLCRKAGFDITTKDFWNSGIKMYEQEINIFAEYVNGSA
ncbi:MAG: M3 family oligoendopeptidase [Treponema sp.]|nr:M3 family oligoendopeptidase [Treponema sp.]